MSRPYAAHVALLLGFAELCAAALPATAMAAPPTGTPSRHRRAPERRGPGAGVDVGTLIGPRLRWNIQGRAVAYVDVRAGLTALLASQGLASTGMVVPQVGFFGQRPVHLVVGVPVGRSFYVDRTHVGLLLAADFDPAGPVHIDMGGIYGVVGDELAVGSVMDLGWVW